MKKRIIAAGVALLALVGLASCSSAPAFADAATPSYTLVAWVIPGGDSSNAFAAPQTLYKTQDQVTVDLAGLDSQLACGTTYQIDAYNDGAVTSALVAGGTLIAPNNPAEDLAYGAPGLNGNPWKYITTEACPTPTPTPTATPPVITPPTVPPTTPSLAYTGYVLPWGWFWAALAAIAFGIGAVGLRRKTHA